MKLEFKMPSITIKPDDGQAIEKQEGFRVPEIVSAKPLTGRSLQLEFDDGTTHLLDYKRLIGPRYVSLMNADVFHDTIIKDGKLTWGTTGITVDSEFLFYHSVPYDVNYVPKPHKPTEKEKNQELFATIFFPVAALAGIVGLLTYFLGQ